jgi:tetratricopeptide (TPR) repeat protein
VTEEQSDRTDKKSTPRTMICCKPKSMSMIEEARWSSAEKALPSACAHEDSDPDSDDADIPVVLPQVLLDLERFNVELGPRSLQVAETWNAVGLIRCRMQRNYASAIKCHNEALKIFQASESSVLQTVVTLTDLGSCYELMQDNEAALRMYLQAEALIQKSKQGEITSNVVFSSRRALARMQRR